MVVKTVERVDSQFYLHSDSGCGVNYLSAEHVDCDIAVGEHREIESMSFVDGRIRIEVKQLPAKSLLDAAREVSQLSYMEKVPEYLAPAIRGLRASYYAERDKPVTPYKKETVDSLLRLIDLSFSHWYDEKRWSEKVDIALARVLTKLRDQREGGKQNVASK